MNVLAISAHPDDETLGCGGTLLRHRANGDEVHWTIATQTFTPNWPQQVIDEKATEVDRVARAYCMKSVAKLGFRTMSLDAVPVSELIDAIRPQLETIQPAVVYLPHFGDVHTDHAALFTAVMSIVKGFHMRALGVQRVLAYETLSSTDAAPPLAQRAFIPTVYHDVSKFIDEKLRIMETFVTEIQRDPLPRSGSAIRALARYRGATVALEYAEAFCLIRQVA